MSLLPSRDGVLKALSLKAYADTGAGVNSTIAALARLIYPAEAKELIDYDVVSNLPPGRPRIARARCVSSKSRRHCDPRALKKQASARLPRCQRRMPSRFLVPPINSNCCSKKLSTSYNR